TRGLGRQRGVPPGVHAARAVNGSRWPRCIARRRALSIGCPHCNSRIETENEPLPNQEIHCPSCGSSFQLESNDTQVWSPEPSGRQLGRFELLETVGTGA